MIIGETPNERHNRECQRDDRHRAMRQYAELTGKGIEYLDESFDPRILAKAHWDMGREVKYHDICPICKQKLNTCACGRLTHENKCRLCGRKNG